MKKFWQLYIFGTTVFGRLFGSFSYKQDGGKEKK